MGSGNGAPCGLAAVAILALPSTWAPKLLWLPYLIFLHLFASPSIS